MEQISEDLKLDPRLLSYVSDHEVVALVSYDWLTSITEHGEVMLCSCLENFTTLQIQSLLHHSCQSFPKQVVKVSISVCDIDLVKQTFIDNPCEAPKNENWSTSSFFDSLCLKDMRTLLLKLHMKHDNSYITYNKTNSSSIDKLKSANTVEVSHVNILPIISTFCSKGKCYFVKPYIDYSVEDGLLYSPAMLFQSATKLHFMLLQVLQMMVYVSHSFPLQQLTPLTWKKAHLDTRQWLQVDFYDIISSSNVFINKNSTAAEFLYKKDLCSHHEDTEICSNLEKWICGKISNYDYLMYLNKLAGRRFGDPHHHPILPWVSDLSTFQQGWRDLSKSKYRLNKGDDQLNLQYSMAISQNAEQGANKIHVPHHIPDMLSDITYYAYLARKIPKTILQKYVRSYWEPNEYPASIQRMQAWSPDECIPEFYTDPSVFYSMHEDMTNLGYPEWSESPEDFVSKHMEMLESDYVSENLHNWIDITFGYKLSGKSAVEELNVCRQLVDQHQTHLKQGIVQIFHSPHPGKCCSPLQPHFNNSIVGKVAARSYDTPGYTNTGMESLTNESEESGEKSESNQIQLPTGYDPFDTLDHLENLFKFKISISGRPDLSSTLQAIVTEKHEELTSASIEEIISDYNVLTFFCLIMELYFASQLKSYALCGQFEKRLEAAVICFKANKSTLPTNVQHTLSYLLNFVEPLQRTLAKVHQYKNSNDVQNQYNVHESGRLLESKNECFPPPTIDQLLCQEMDVFSLPQYFLELYDFLEMLIIVTDTYRNPPKDEDLLMVEKSFIALLTSLKGCSDGFSILMPHVISMFDFESLYATKFFVITFNQLAQELGVKETCQWYLKPVNRLYENVNHLLMQSGSDNNGEVYYICNILYDKSLLVQLCNRFSLTVFLETIPRHATECLVRMKRKTEILMDSIQWMMRKVGPTLTSKHIIRPLLWVINLCFYDDSDVVPNNYLQVIDCLQFASAMYGPSLFTLQYIPHISYTVSTAISGTQFSDRSLAALEASCTVLTHLLQDQTGKLILDQLPRLSKEIFEPLIGTLASKRIKFPGGGEKRKQLCLKITKLFVQLAICIGRDQAQKHLTGLFQSLFSNFVVQQHGGLAKECPAEEPMFEIDDLDMKHFLSPSEDSIAVAVQMGDKNGQFSKDFSEGKGGENYKSMKSKHKDKSFLSKEQKLKYEAIKREIEEAFCPETAYHAYVPITRLVGVYHMERVLLGNHDCVWGLSSTYETALKGDTGDDITDKVDKDKSDKFTKATVIGNKIVVNKSDTLLCSNPTNDIYGKDLNENGYTHLNGNWLAYWEHEIGLADDDGHIHFNQISLQNFVGHSAAVKSLHSSECESWFMSSGKDKTVKLWPLHGSTSDTVEPLFVYRQHKKTVFYASLVGADHSVVSCDGNIHVWDPYTGNQVACYDSIEFKPGITSVLCLPDPLRQVLINNSETIKLIDLRTQHISNEYKTAVGPSAGIIRTLCSNGNTIVSGFSSGIISVCDLRMGPILRIWQAHDNDVVSLLTVSDKMFVSTSLDQSIAMWEFNNPNAKMVYRSVAEPLQAVKLFHNELITASSNRISVLALPAQGNSLSDSTLRSVLDKPIATTKLRSDCIRGSLTSISILPLKRQMLVCSDTGAIRLLA